MSNLKTLVSASFTAGLLSTGTANAADGNPFQSQLLEKGFMLAEAGKAPETDKKTEGKCGGDKKMKDGKCGGDKAKDADKKKDGKCGEGKCGARMKKDTPQS